MEALELIQEEEISNKLPPFPVMGEAPPSFPNTVGEASPSYPIPEHPSPCEENGGSSLYQSSDHVSCEDLLDFALDRPNCRRTQGPAHGKQSDEVHLMLKVLKQEVSK